MFKTEKRFCFGISTAFFQASEHSGEVGGFGCLKEKNPSVLLESRELFTRMNICFCRASQKIEAKLHKVGPTGSLIMRCPEDSYKGKYKNYLKYSKHSESIKLHI